MDNFTSIWNRLLLRAPSVGAALAQDLVRDSFNQLAERREWSWLMRSSAFYPSVFYQTGLAACAPNSNIVVGADTAWDLSFVGSQFRVGANPSNFPTYTILAVPSATTLILDSPWIGPPVNSAYQIFQCYFAVPKDFQYFYSLVNVTSNYRLWHNATQAMIDQCDPQRVQSGQTYAAAFYDYTQTTAGTVGSTFQVSGSGPTPTSTTSYGYSYPANSTYVITITAGGVPGDGTLAFAWRQDTGASSTIAVGDNTAIDLSNGVQVYFQDGTYVTGDSFIINCIYEPQSGVPRYELWPRPINNPFVYPFTYACKLPALTDLTPTLPEFVARRGDVLLEMSLANAASFPGTSTTANPYYDLGLADRHRTRSESLIYELEKKDDDTAMKDLQYANLSFYPAPWLDGSWLQRHAMGPF